MPESPTSRTMKRLKKDGIPCGVVERWVTFGPPKKGMPSGIRKDLFGIIDVVALDLESQQIIGIQCGALSGHAGHRTKILLSDHAEDWLNCKGRIEIWSWGKKLAKKGGKAMRWSPKIESITVEQIKEYENDKPF